MATKSPNHSALYDEYLRTYIQVSVDSAHGLTTYEDNSVASLVQTYRTAYPTLGNLETTSLLAMAIAYASVKNGEPPYAFTGFREELEMLLADHPDFATAEDDTESET